MRDRDPSFKNDGQSSKVDNAARHTLLPEGVKEASVVNNEGVENRSALKDHSIDECVDSTLKDSNAKKGSNQKRPWEAIQRVGGTSQSYRRQRSSPHKPRREIHHESPHIIREERQVQNLRHQGSPNSCPPRNLVNTTYTHGHRLNHASNESVEQRSATVSFVTEETSLYNSRTENNMSATSNYSFSDAMDNARMASSSYGARHPDPQIAVGLHHQGPPRQGYLRLGFAPNLTNPGHHPSMGGWIED